MIQPAIMKFVLEHQAFLAAQAAEIVKQEPSLEDSKLYGALTEIILVLGKDMAIEIEAPNRSDFWAYYGKGWEDAHRKFFEQYPDLRHIDHVPSENYLHEMISINTQNFFSTIWCALIPKMMKTWSEFIGDREVTVEEMETIILGSPMMEMFTVKEETPPIVKIPGTDSWN